MHPRDYCIVVAEDDEMLRYCTVRLLAEHGYKIIEARDGAHALELLEQCDDVVHLLVTNYDMPRLNGVELARRLRRKHERLMGFLYRGKLQPSIRAKILRCYRSLTTRQSSQPRFASC
jgi:CheY-like chemotaxis protein